MINCYRAIALSFGYVESGMTSWLIYSAEAYFPTTKKQALYSLTEYLWNKFCMEKNESVEDKIVRGMNDCCRQFWYRRNHSKPKPSNCGTCNTFYNLSWEFSEVEWMGYLFDLYKSNCDSYGDHEYVKDFYGWTPWRFEFNIPQNQMLIISENAEVFLTMALFELHPELREKLGNECETPNPKDSKDEYAFTAQEWHVVLDEKSQLINGSYSYPQNQKTYCETIITDYVNGGRSVVVNGRCNYVKYNTGDQIWLKYIDDEYFVYKVKTHDGILIERNK